MSRKGFLAGFRGAARAGLMLLAIASIVGYFVVGVFETLGARVPLITRKGHTSVELLIARDMRWLKPTDLRHTVIGFGRLATFDVDLNWLATFAMVAEDLNFHRAAAHLGVTQPAVSKRVAHLEDKLDRRLLTDQQKRAADP